VQGAGRQWLTRLCRALDRVLCALCSLSLSAVERRVQAGLWWVHGRGGIVGSRMARYCGRVAGMLVDDVVQARALPM
jgi:hypothetical protein